MPATDRRHVVTHLDRGAPDPASLLQVSGRAVPCDRHGGADLAKRPAYPEIAR